MTARACKSGLLPHDAALADYIAALLDATACVDVRGAAALPDSADDASIYCLCAVSGVQLAIAKQAVEQVAPLPPLTAAEPASPAWLLGTLTHGGRVFHAVDLARIVAPGGLAQSLPACAITLVDSHWLLAVDGVTAEQAIATHGVRWRERALSRPWLAGMASEPLCAVLDIAGLHAVLARELQCDPA